ncbi:MAG: glycosyltransferase family 2 protein [Pseudomonadota bacterium]|nr:glycosyltransferase family 2 protein [Pseudomonadota bacterium]
MTSVAVVTVNYGTPDLSIAAVESVLARDHGGRSVEVHLVDNASPGGDAEAFRQAHAARGWGDRVTLWLETENHGFGRGNNLVLKRLAARAAPPTFVFLLNPDATLENEAIDILAHALEDHPKAAVAGAGIAFPDGRPAVACFRFPSLLSEVVSTLDFGPVYRVFPKGKVSLPPDWPEGEVDWVAGASVMMRLSALAEVGFFDPDFFLYYEEVELMRRLRREGYRTLYVPRARVSHIAGAATDVSSHDPRPRRRPAYVYDSWRLYFEKVHGRGYALATSMAKIPAALAGGGLSRLRRRPSGQPIGFIGDHWRHVVRPLLRRPAE